MWVEEAGETVNETHRFHFPCGPERRLSFDLRGTPRWDPFVSLNTFDSRRRIQSSISKTEMIKQSEGDFKIKFLNFSKRYNIVGL